MTQTHTFNRLRVAAVSLALTGGGYGVKAQENISEDATEDNIEVVQVTSSYTVDEVVDTATGLGLTLQETPQSVSVFTAQRILDQNIDTIAEVAFYSTGVSVNQVDDIRNVFNSRGFDINNYQVDGVPLAYTLSGGAGETVLDVSIYERLEIVRGATGLLTGVGDPSASINLVRKHADKEELTGYVNARVGRWENVQVTADVAGALTENGATRARTVVRYEQGESNVNLFENQKLVLYGVLEQDLSDSTLLRIGASHQDQRPDSPAWGALPSFYSDGSFTQWPRSQTSSADWTFWDTVNQNVFATLEHQLSNGWLLSFNYNWLRNAQETEILYLSGVVDRDTGLGLGAFPYSDDGENTQHSFDFQLQGDYELFNRTHEFVFGALHSEQEYVNDTFNALTTPAVGSYYDIQDGSYPYPGFGTDANRAVDMDTKQSGVYAATRLHVDDAFKVIVGGRISSWEQVGINFSPEFDFGDNDVFVPYAGLLYDVAKDHTLYVSYTEIFQPQNAQDGTGAFLDPIVGDNAEIGLKSSFFGDALQTSIAIFRIEQDNLAEMDPGQVIPGTPFPASRAGDGPTSEGFEIEILGSPLPGWNINLGYSDFEIEDANGEDFATDNPRQLFNLFTTYRFVDSLPDLELGLGVNWQGKMFTDTANPVTGQPARLQQDAYTLVNLMARYHLSEDLYIQANIDNLTDETYFTQVGFFEQYRYGRPREYNFHVTYTF